MSITRDDLNNRIKIPVPPLAYQQKMAKQLSDFDELDEYFNKMALEAENNTKTAFMNSLDDYG